MLRELRAREKLARELTIDSVWHATVEHALALQQQDAASVGSYAEVEAGSSAIVEQEQMMEQQQMEEDDDEEACEFGVDLTQPFDFDWVDHSFTTFCGADAFIGRLDYILPDRRSLRVARAAPMPESEQAALATGWPCVGHPSDHVSLLYDLVPIGPRDPPTEWTE